MTGELAFIERVRALVPAVPDGQVGIGDDCAVLDGGLLLALDTMVEGTHFRLDWCSGEDVGWKAVAVNVSDVAAMAGEPVACVVGLTLPSGGGHDALADEVTRGVVAAAATLGCPLLGGDTTAGGSVLVISVAIVGRVPDLAEPVLRSGARVGDAVFVTGPLGRARAALDSLMAGRTPPADAAARLHRPAPRVAEGCATRIAGATAMIDVSDGLAADLGHICDESGVGVTLDADAIPLADGVALDDALTGGDDYELCFTAPDADRVRATFAEAGLTSPVEIGRITPTGAGRTLASADGTNRPLPAAGFEHSL